MDTINRANSVLQRWSWFLIANSPHIFLLFTCLILFTYKKFESILVSYKKTAIYKKDTQSGCLHLSGRLLFDKERETFQNVFSLAGYHPASVLLQTFYHCIMRKVPSRALRSHLGIIWATEKILLRGWVAVAPQERNTYVYIYPQTRMCYFHFQYS